MMALTDIFTGAPATEAAANQRNIITQLLGLTGQNAINTQGLITGNLLSGQDLATQALMTGGTGAVNALTGARSDLGAFLPPSLAALDPSSAIAAIAGGNTGALGALTGGNQAAIDAINRSVGLGVDSYAPLRLAAGDYGTQRLQSSQMSADALGLNGPQGVARAQAAFQTSPGYDFALNQGLNSIVRNANAAGMAAGGNQLRESQTFGQGLANQEWGNWLNRLFGREQFYTPQERGALTDVAGGQAGAILGGGRNVADLLSRGGAGAADILSRG